MAETAPATSGPNHMYGIVLMCGALAMFAGLDATAKLLIRELPLPQVIWARYAGHFFFALAFVMRDGDRFRVWQTRQLGFQLGRSLLLLLATCTNFIALQFLQLSVTSAMLFTVPLIVAALSVPLLGERVGPHRWAAIVIGFAGVLVVARPGFGLVHWAIGFAFMTALFAGLYQLSARRAALTDDVRTTQLYAAVVGVVFTTPLLFTGWHNPGVRGWLLFALMGLLAAVGHYWLTLAHRYAAAAVLAPFFYVHIVWMTGLGFLLFGDVPDQWTVVGAGIVVAGGLYLVHRERLHAVAARSGARSLV